MDDAQPDEGQGSPFDSYLSTVPEDAREPAEAWFKDTSKSLNEKLEQASELKKQWEPYSQIQDLPEPEQLSELLAWSNQTLTDQETFDAWITEQAESKGMTRAEAAELVEDAETEGLSQEQIQQITDERAQQLIQPLMERQEQFETERGVDMETQAITSELNRLETEDKVELSEVDRAIVIKLGMDSAYDAQGNELPAGDASWVQQGFNEFREIGTAAQQAFVSQKAMQPQSAVTTGGMASQKPVTTFDDAKEVLRERWKAQNT